MNLAVDLISEPEMLGDDDIRCWNRLARTPLMRWEWLGRWFAAHRDTYRFSVLRICRAGQPIALVPWCWQHRITTGATLQFLGSGKASTDHLSLLVEAEHVDPVCRAVACWLAGEADHGIKTGPNPIRWDSLELIGSDADDIPIARLVETLREMAWDVDVTDGVARYEIPLPGTWEEYVEMRSKSGRREIRRALGNIDSGRIQIDEVRSESELDQSWPRFVKLHQRRRQSAGTRGCFDHPNFEPFLREAASQLLRQNMLRLLIATSEGMPVAAQFSIVNDTCWHFYQSGMEPDREHLRPGLSLFCHAIRQSIDDGRKRFDMMRGEEPYKQRWRAVRVATQEIRVCHPRIRSRIRGGMYRATKSLKGLIRGGLTAGLQASPSEPIQ